MANSKKIRNLVDPDGNDVCWQEFLLKCVELSGPLRDLEYSSKKSDLAKAKKIFKDAERLFKKFKIRIGKEVTDDVNLLAKLKSKSYKGNPGALIEYRKNK